MTLVKLPISIDSEALGRFARVHGIGRLALFGSVLREDFTDASDVDILVEYLPGRHPGLMLFDQEQELARCLGRPVDLHTPASLNRFFRDRVLAEALPIYAEP
jgi:predicted nucleotidyltransferase